MAAEVRCTAGKTFYQKPRKQPAPTPLIDLAFAGKDCKHRDTGAYDENLTLGTQLENFSDEARMATVEDDVIAGLDSERAINHFESDPLNLKKGYFAFDCS
ncbi:hypothetical protein [Bradyrhizobium sp. G127]|uniref:hypothetical protein n=1 Tax=Bradyrhizobium sp. G127 TaxID=2904800 RepID=UPI001F43588D|nr:hypothetical protein [Bradyrhizobium sp. G127]MCF2521668.1 hypothetical protein [Bradyrhizobium sp. G127]